MDTCMLVAQSPHRYIVPAFMGQSEGDTEKYKAQKKINKQMFIKNEWQSWFSFQYARWVDAITLFIRFSIEVQN